MQKKVFTKICPICNKDFYGFTEGQVASQKKIHTLSKHKVSEPR